MRCGGKRGSSAPSGGSASLRGRQGRGVIGISGSQCNFSKVHRGTGIALRAPPAVTLGIPDVGAPTDDFLVRLALFGGCPLALPCRSLDLFCNVRGGL
jgi:hypothetical protein